MNLRQLRRLAILGEIPLEPRYLKPPPRLKKVRVLERDGWILSGEGFADQQMSLTVYRSYFRDENVDINKEAAIPHYPVFSGNPDYWMYGRMIMRSYIHYYADGDRIEQRGVTFHGTPTTKTFKHEKLEWEESGWWVD